jgi:hypothetical protein
VLIGTAEVALDNASIAAKDPRWKKKYFECQDEVAKEAGAVECSVFWQFSVPNPCSSPPETDIEGDSDVDDDYPADTLTRHNARVGCTGGY